MARKLVQPKVLVLVALVFLLTMTVAAQQGRRTGNGVSMAGIPAARLSTEEKE